MGRSRQCLGGGLDRLGVRSLHRFLQRGHCFLDLGLVFCSDLVAMLTQVLLSSGRSGCRPGFGFGGLPPLLIFVGMGLCILHQLFDFFLTQAAGRRDLDGLFFCVAKSLAETWTMPVGVDVERHLDLRHPARRGRNADQVELAEELVVVRHLAFALEDSNGHRRLIVGSRREDLALFRRDGRVPLDQLRKDTAEGFDAQRAAASRRGAARPSRRLSTRRLEWRRRWRPLRRDSHPGAVLCRKVFDGLNHFRHAGHAADEDDFVDVAGRHAGIGQGLFAGINRSLNRGRRPAVQASRG